MKIGYARVSTDDQNLDLQRDALKAAGCERIIEEKESGSKDDRPELARALDMLRAGDEFVVYKLDRMARSTLKLLATLNEIHDKGAEFISLSDKIDTTSAAGRALFGMLAVFAEFERNIIVERTKAGLAAARARGRNGGRPKTDQKKVLQAIKLYESKQHSLAEIHEMTGVTSSTLYRAIKERAVEV